MGNHYDTDFDPLAKQVAFYGIPSSTTLNLIHWVNKWPFMTYLQYDTEFDPLVEQMAFYGIPPV